MKYALLMVSLLAGAPALAQAPIAPPPPAPQTEPPPAPVAPPPPVAAQPPSQAAPAPAPAASSPDHLQLQPPKLGQSRYGRFSRGPGGPLLVFGGVVTGIVTGITLSAGLGGTSQDAFTAGVLGGTVVGGLAALYNYYVYTSLYGSMLDVLASASGYMLGFGIDLMAGTHGDAQYILPALVANAAFLASALLHANSDVDADSAMMSASGAIYGFWLAALATGWVSASGSHTDGSPLLVSPMAGLILGTLLASQLHVEASRMFELTLLPIGVGVALLYLGTLTGSVDRGEVWALSLAGTAVTFALTAVFTSNPETPAQQASSETVPFQVAPALSFVRASDESIRPALGLHAAF